MYEIHNTYEIYLGFPGVTVLNNLPVNARDTIDAGSIRGLGRSHGERNDRLPQYSCLENYMHRGVCWAVVQGFAKSQTCLSD